MRELRKERGPADRILERLAALAPWAAAALVGLPILFGLAFTLLPAFGWLPALGGTVFSLRPFRELFAEPGIGRSAWLSLSTGLIASVLSLGLVLLFLAGFSGTKAFERFRGIVAPLLALPHAAAAFGLAFLLAPSGLAARIVSPEWTGWTVPPDWRVVNDPDGLFLAAGLAAKEIPFLLLVAMAALPQTQAPQRRMLAASLGYGRAAGFLFGTWPAVYRRMRLAVFAVIAFSTSVTDVAAILGPSTPPTLSLRLIQWSSDPDLSRRFVACAGAVLQLFISAGALLLWIGGERICAALRNRLACFGRRFPRDRPLRALAAVLAFLTAGSLAGGAVALGLWSLAGLWQFPDALPQRLALDSWQRLAPRLLALGSETLLLGLASTAAALLLAVLMLHREERRSQAAGGRLFLLPLLLPQAAFLFGLQLLFLLGGLAANRAAVALAHLVFVLPYVLLALGPPWKGFDRRYEQMAASLSHGPAARLFRVRLPMLLPALLTAAAIGFAVSVGLYLPTLLIGAGRVSTITTEAVALASGGNRRVIGVFAFAQMALPFAGFAVALLLPRLVFRNRRGMRA